MLEIYIILAKQIYMSDIQCVFESITGKGSIYISNYAAAQDLQLLKSTFNLNEGKNIKAVLSVAKSGLLKHEKEDIPFYLYLPAHDHEEYDIYKYFNQTYDFIEVGRRHTNVLVHCMAGISRSVTIVIAYLLKKYKYSLGDVINMLQRKRSKINPNKGFIEQLKKYAQQQGLNCNFDFEQVPRQRQKSHSKDNKARSKQKSSLAHYNQVVSPQKGKSKGSKQYNSQKYDHEAVRIIENKTIKSNQLNYPSKQKALISNKIQIKRANCNLGQSSDEQNTSKYIVKDHSKSPKKQSIEQKIMKLRKKIMDNQERKKSTEKHNQSYGKQNESNSPNKSKTLKVNNLSQYFSLYAKNHPLSLKPTEQRFTSKEKALKQQHNEQYEIIFSKTEGSSFSKRYVK